VSGSDISWAICKSAPRSRQITTPAPYNCFFTGRVPFLPPNQQRQSSEGINTRGNLLEIYKVSCKLPGSVRPFFVNVLDSSCVSKIFNTMCTKSPVENILQQIRVGMILGLATLPSKCHFLHKIIYLPVQKLCKF